MRIIFGQFIFVAYFCTANKQNSCCCSSVVEHFLGKEEVTSSILVNSSKQNEDAKRHPKGWRKCLR